MLRYVSEVFVDVAPDKLYINLGSYSFIIFPNGSAAAGVPGEFAGIKTYKNLGEFFEALTQILEAPQPPTLEAPETAPYIGIEP